MLILFLRAVLRRRSRPRSVSSSVSRTCISLWTAPDSETVNTTIVPYEWTNIPEGSTILSSKWEYKTTYTQLNVVRLFAGMAEYTGGWYNEEGPIPKSVTYTYYRYRTATFVK